MQALASLLLQADTFPDIRCSIAEFNLDMNTTPDILYYFNVIYIMKYEGLAQKCKPAWRLSFWVLSLGVRIFVIIPNCWYL